MKLNDPMTVRQKEHLDKQNIVYQGDETVEEAADLLREHIKAPLYKPMALPETAFAVESEGDRGDGRQWQP